MEIFKVENVNFTFAESSKRALNAVSFTIQQGSFAVLFGASGSGKTTLLQLLKRELTPNGKRDGEIFYKGELLEDIDAKTLVSEIGFVMQKPDDQIVMDTVWHELAFGLENMGLSNAQIRKKIAEMTSYFGMGDWFHKKISELSGGQKQLLNLASILIMQPKLLILDEPTSQLDPIAATEFMQTLHRLHEDTGVTIILVEHRLEDVFQFASDIMLIENGSIIAQGSPRIIGQIVKKINEHHIMLEALPTATRIYYGLSTFTNESPITIREGMEFIGNYKNEIQELPRNIIEQKIDKPILAMKDCWFRYGRDFPDIVKGVSLKIQKGEIFCILGGNGAGKTTLLKLLAGQCKPYKGYVLLHDKKMKKYSMEQLYKKNIALLPQNPKTLFLQSTIREDYEVTAKLIGFDKMEASLQIERVMKMLHIESLMDMHPHSVSGGELQKIAIGKLLLLQPKILLLDEPTKGIDVFAKKQLQQLLQQLRVQGMTIIIVTHDMDFAAEIADCCGLYFDGEVLAIDVPKSFFAQNNYYTTAANKIARQLYPNAVTCEDVIELCIANGLDKK
mgnify:FL=1